MIELVFLVCLNTAPDVCEERSLLFVDVSPMTCMMGAQPELAKWTATHQRWHIERWSCRIPNTRSAEL